MLCYLLSFISSVLRAPSPGEAQGGVRCNDEAEPGTEGDAWALRAGIRQPARGLIENQKASAHAGMSSMI